MQPRKYFRPDSHSKTALIVIIIITFLSLSGFSRAQFLLIEETTNEAKSQEIKTNFSFGEKKTIVMIP